MELHWPRTVDEAVALLAGGEDVRPHAGGATLVAMMNAGLVEPRALVFLRGIDELVGIEAGQDGDVAIGAMTTHRAVAASEAFVDGQAVVPRAAGAIAHQPIRAVGTIGGAVAHADPAGDYPPALVAVDAIVETAAGAGGRSIPAAEFFVDYYETALEEGEMVRAVTIPKAPPGSVAVYDKLARVEGDFATVSVALVLAMEAGACRHVRLVAGGCGPIPVRCLEAEERLLGTDLGASDLREAALALVARCDPVDDVRGSADYRRAVLPRMVARAVGSALRRSEAAR